MKLVDQSFNLTPTTGENIDSSLLFNDVTFGTSQSGPLSSLAIESAPQTHSVPIPEMEDTAIPLPSSDYITDARFYQDGSDLHLILPDGDSFVVEGYFAASTPPSLVTEQGLNLSPRLVDSFLMPLAPGQVAQIGGSLIDGGAGDAIGSVDFVAGEVFAVRTDGTREQLYLGDPVYQGDQIETAADGSVKMQFVDETIFTLGEDARLALDELVFDPSSISGSSAFSILKGSFVFVSGQIAHDNYDNMEVSTPVATIGIRGTTVAGDIQGDSYSVSVLEGSIAVESGGETITVSDTFGTISGAIDSTGQMRMTEATGATGQGVIQSHNKALKALGDNDLQKLQNTMEQAIEEQTGEKPDLNLKDMIKKAEDVEAEAEAEANQEVPLEVAPPPVNGEPVTPTGDAVQDAPQGEGEPVAKELTAEEIAAEALAAEELAAQELAAQELAAQEAGEEAPLGDAPLGDAPIGDAPLGDAPLGDAPVGDAPLGDAPVGGTPDNFDGGSGGDIGESGGGDIGESGGGDIGETGGDDRNPLGGGGGDNLLGGGDDGNTGGDLQDPLGESVVEPDELDLPPPPPIDNNNDPIDQTPDVIQNPVTAQNISTTPNLQPLELLSNGGFETGDFEGWTVGITPTIAEGGSPLYNAGTGDDGWDVTNINGPASGYANPINGYTAFNGFDGGVNGDTEADLIYHLSQSFALNDGFSTANLSFNFDIEGGPSITPAEDRIFSVHILDNSGNDLGEVYNYAVVGGTIDGLPLQNVSLDLSNLLTPLGAGSYKLAFTETIPQSFTGSGSFAIDDISLTIDGDFDIPLTATEDGSPITGTFVGNDINTTDGNSSLIYSILTQPVEGHVTNNDDGTFEFTPNQDFQDLNTGETRQVTFTYVAENTNGTVSAPATVTVTVEGVDEVFISTLGDDIYTAGSGDNVLFGDAGNDTLDGGAGHDTIDGGTGVDTLNGGAGNDTIDGGLGDDIIDGGAGTDTYIAATASQGMDIDMSSTGTATIVNDGYGSIDTTFINIENITGTDYVDILVGNASNNILNGGADDDVLVGGAGDDTLVSGTGSGAGYTYEILDGGAGDDTLDGSLSYGFTSYDGTGNDTILGSGYNDLFYADAGHDNYDGGGNSDTINFQSATSGITINYATNGYSGAINADGFGSGDIFSNVEYIIGSNHADTFVGSVSLTYGNILGGAGDDTFFGQGLADALFGEAGNDFMDGGAGNDQLYGGDGNDILVGGLGADYLDGGAGIDRLDYSGANIGMQLQGHLNQISWDGYGVASNGVNGSADTYTNIEEFYGSSYADGFWVGQNSIAEVYDGQGGNDSIDFSNATSHITVNFTADNAGTVAFNGVTQIDSFANIERLWASNSVTGDDITGSSGADYIWGLNGNDTIRGEAGNDFLYGDNGDDTLLGGDGNDILSGDSGNDTLNGGAGDDIIIGGTGLDVIDGGNGTDTLIHAGAAITLSFSAAGAGTFTNDGYGFADSFVDIERIDGSGANDTITGHDGDDYFTGNNGDDTLTGNNGDDFLHGGNGNDIINGGAGFDFIDGGEGQDNITLGAGVDILYYTAFTESSDQNYDVINDFVTTEDKIQFSADMVTGSLTVGTILDAGSLGTFNSNDGNAKFFYDGSVAHFDLNGDGSEDMLIMTDQIEAYDIELHDTVVAGGAATTATFQEGHDPIFIYENESITAGDSPMMEKAYFQITYADNITWYAGADVLSATAASANIDVNFNTVTGLLTLSGSDTVANYAATIQSIAFSTTSEDTTTGRGVTGKIGDGKHFEDLTSVDITMTQNNGPVANSDTFSLAEGASIADFDFLANDTDADNDNLTVTNITATNGTFLVNGNGNLDYTASNFTGQETISYTITDGVDTSTGTILVNVGFTAPS